MTVWRTRDSSKYVLILSTSPPSSSLDSLLASRQVQLSEPPSWTTVATGSHAHTQLHPDPIDGYEPYYADQPHIEPYPPPSISSVDTPGPSKHRAGRSISRTPHLTRDDSIAVASPPMPKKRGRPFKNPHLNVHLAHSVHPATPNGHAGSHQPSKPRTPGRRSATPRQPVSNANGKGKGKGKAVPTGQALAGDTIHAAAVIFDPNCSFCYGTDKRNKQGVPERMVSCHRCGRCGHPSCLQMESPQLIETIFGYKWNCMECKACEVCQIKGDDVSDTVLGSLRATLPQWPEQPG